MTGTRPGVRSTGVIRQPAALERQAVGRYPPYGRTAPAVVGQVMRIIPPSLRW